MVCRFKLPSPKGYGQACPSLACPFQNLHSESLFPHTLRKAKLLGTQIWAAAFKEEDLARADSHLKSRVENPDLEANHLQR